MKIIYASVGACATGCRRLIYPLEALAKSFLDVEIEPLNLLDRSKIDYADIFVTQCAIGAKAMSFLYECRKKGKKIVIDYDDSFADLPEIKLKEFNMTSKEVTENWIRYLNLADLITVSCDPLKDRVESFTRTPVKVVPNLILKSEYKESEGYTPDRSRIRILYSCSESHIKDFKFIAPVLKRIGESYKKVTIVSHGNLNFSYFCPKYKGETLHIENGPYESYYEVLRGIQPSILIAPLMPTIYNNCRSNLKYLQASLVKAAFVGNRLPPYRNVEHNKTGLLPFTRISWWWSLRRLVRDPKLLSNTSRAAHKDLKNYLLEDNIELWNEAYRGILTT